MKLYLNLEVVFYIDEYDSLKEYIKLKKEWILLAYLNHIH